MNHSMIVEDRVRENEESPPKGHPDGRVLVPRMSQEEGGIVPTFSNTSPHFTVVDKKERLILLHNNINSDYILP